MNTTDRQRFRGSRPWPRPHRILLTLAILYVYPTLAFSGERVAFEAFGFYPPGSFFGSAIASPVNFGNYFQVSSMDPILITRLGVFDRGGDGLANPHPIGIWLDHNGSYQLTPAIVPTGNAGELIDGFRYVSIPPVLVTPRTLFAVGALYGVPDAAGGSDADIIGIPAGASFTGGITPGGLWGNFSSGPELTRPEKGVGMPRGGEGSGNYYFNPVNFVYEVIPEPQPTLLAGLALSALWLCRKDRRDSRGCR